MAILAVVPYTQWVHLRWLQRAPVPLLRPVFFIFQLSGFSPEFTPPPQGKKVAILQEIGVNIGAEGVRLAGIGGDCHDLGLRIFSRSGLFSTLTI